MTIAYFKRLLFVLALAIAMGWIGTRSCHAAAFPYITLNEYTNRVSDNGTNLTYNGVAIGGGGSGDTIWTAVPNDGYLTGSIFSSNSIVQFAQGVDFGNYVSFFAAALGTNDVYNLTHNTNYEIIGLGNVLANANFKNNVGAIYALGDNAFGLSDIEYFVSQITGIGHNALQAIVITNLVDNVYALGDSILNASHIENGAHDITAIGDYVLSSSSIYGPNTYDVTAIGQSTMTSCLVSNSVTDTIAIGAYALASSTIVNVKGPMAIGYHAGEGDTPKSYSFALGPYAHTTNQWDFTFGNSTNNYFFPGAKIDTAGTIQTGDPGSGRAAWKLGQTITGAIGLTLVTTNYVEVNIGGSVVKLAIVK